MGAQENQILEAIENLILNAGGDSAEVLKQTEPGVKQEESRPVPTGLMSIYAGCADVW